MTDKPKRKHPFAIRFRQSALEAGKRNAARFGMNFNAYINHVAEFPGFAPPLEKQTELVKLLAQVIAVFGKGRVSQNLNQIAIGIHTSSLPITPDSEKLLTDTLRSHSETCDAVKAILLALGFKR